MNKQVIREIEDIIGYSYSNSSLLVQAFTHSSYANENNVLDYERLEFLGDSILETITTIFLYHHYHESEGDLSKLRASVVSAPSISKVIDGLGLTKYIRVGGSVGHNMPTNIIADVFEAIVASIYLDSGFDNAQKFVLDNLIVSEANIKTIQQDLVDYKTILQEKLQAKGYRAKYESKEIKKGTSVEFEVSLVVNDKILATEISYSKKLGELACAKKFLENNGGEHFEF